MTKSSTTRRGKRVAKKSTSNGKSSNGVVTLAEHEAKKIREANQSIVNMKMELANARLRRDAAEKREKELLRLIAASGEQLQAEAKECAEAHGIDLDSGAWTLQIDKGEFVQASSN